MSLEQCNIAVQAVLPDDQLPAGASLVIFARSLAGSIGSAIGQNVYQQTLRKQLSGVVPSRALTGDTGATDLVSSISAQFGQDRVVVEKVLSSVNYSLTRVFMVALILACLTLPAGLVVEWKSVKKEKRKNEDAKEKAGRRKKTFH